MPTFTQTAAIRARPTDWTDTVTLNQVDPAGLTSIGLSLAETLDSGVIVENLEQSAASFTDTTAAIVHLDRPGGAPWLDTTAETTLSATLGAFDGTVDGAGPSGSTLTAARDAASATPATGQLDPADAAILEGSGTVQLPVAASARVSATGPGNMLAVFASTVAASVTLQATYDGSTRPPTGSGVTIAIPPSSPPLGAVDTAWQVRTIARAATGTDESVTLRGFDQHFGRLVEIQFGFTASADGSVAAENLGAVASTVAFTQNAVLDVLGSDGHVLTGGAAETLTGSEHLAAFDGALDFAGASGAATASAPAPGYDATQTTFAFVSDDATLAALTGASTTLQVARSGQTHVDGPGNFAVGSSLDVGGTVSVRYTYVPADPGLSATASLFDGAYYLAHNPDVAAAGIDPLQHYDQFGWHEGRNPSAAFDTGDYLAANPDVAASGLDPLEHYANFGQAEGRAEFAVPSVANPLVDAAYYYAAYADVRAAGVDAAAHFLTDGWVENRNPDALFDTTYYLAHDPALAAAHTDPLLAYQSGGWQAGRDPSAAFSTSKYLAANPDVRAAGVDPLQHYLQFGQAEGRAIFPA